MARTVLGIDPGLSGALASWDGKTLTVKDIPSFKSKGRGSEVDGYELHSLMVNEFADVDIAYLERVNTRPGEGRSSAFKFGTVNGILLGMLYARNLDIVTPTPRVWKKHFGLSAVKSEAVEKACFFFGKRYADLFYGPRGGLLDGRAEAALIAKYGYDKETA